MRISVGALLAYAALAGMCLAADAEASIRRPTAILRQPLASALQLLVKEHNIQLAYRAELIGDQETPGARGDLTATEALTQLLSGTGLTYAYLDDKTLTILPVRQWRME